MAILNEVTVEVSSMRDKLKFKRNKRLRINFLNSKMISKKGIKLSNSNNQSKRKWLCKISLTRFLNSVHERFSNLFKLWNKNHHKERWEFLTFNHCLISILQIYPKLSKKISFHFSWLHKAKLTPLNLKKHSLGEFLQ